MKGKTTIQVSDKPKATGNAISRVQGAISKLSNEVANGGISSELITFLDERYLRKNKADTAQYDTTFNGDVILGEGLATKDASESATNGKGAILSVDTNGYATLQIDNVNIRSRVTLNDIMIQQAQHVNGINVTSAGGITISKIEMLSSTSSNFPTENAGYINDTAPIRCYFDNKKGTLYNTLVTGDVVLCERVSIDTVSLAKYYKRRVLGVGVDYVDLESVGYTKEGYDGTVTIGDNIIQWGHLWLFERMSVVEINTLNGGRQTFYRDMGNVRSVLGEALYDEPYEYLSTSDKQLMWNSALWYGETDKNAIDIGYIQIDANTFKNMMRIYGDIYVGARDQSSYMQFDTVKRLLTVKGDINATSGTFNDVQIYGSMRSPFAEVLDSFTPSLADNFFSQEGGMGLTISLDWDISQSGRRITILGNTYINAPSEKYFFEGGAKLSSLDTSGGVELLGVTDLATGTEFAGWMVVNRFYYALTHRYGRQINPLAYGTIKGTSSSASLEKAVTFDGSELSVSRLSTGKYKLIIPNNWFQKGKVIQVNNVPSYADIDTCLVMATGLGAIVGGSSPIKAQVYEKIQTLDSSQNITQTYILFDTSDDETENDGSLMFMIYNANTWL